jgi:hypothetical protein
MYLQTAKKPATRLARLPMPIYNQAAGHLDPLAIQVFVCPSEILELYRAAACVHHNGRVIE